MGMEEVRNARRILMKVVEDMRGSTGRSGFPGLPIAGPLAPIHKEPAP